MELFIFSNPITVIGYVYGLHIRQQVYHGKKQPKQG
jgi:hypothetical protein